MEEDPSDSRSLTEKVFEDLKASESIFPLGKSVRLGKYLELFDKVNNGTANPEEIFILKRVDYICDHLYPFGAVVDIPNE